MGAIKRRQFDALIIGAGGGGLRAALQLSNADASVTSDMPRLKSLIKNHIKLG